MNRDIFVVTKYYNKGELWGDNHHDEEPIAAFKNLPNAIRYCSNRGSIQELSDYDEHIGEYKIFEEDNYIKCPVGKKWEICDQDYDDDFCSNCWDNNWMHSHDFSYELLKIYRICLFADFTIDTEGEYSMEYLVGQLPGGKIYGKTKGTPDEVAWVLEKIEKEDLKQECVCSIDFGYAEDVSEDTINNIINTERYINQVIENKRGGN